MSKKLTERIPYRYDIQSAIVTFIKCLPFIIAFMIVIWLAYTTLFTFKVEPNTIVYDSHNNALQPGTHTITPFEQLSQPQPNPFKYHTIDVVIPCNTNDGMHLTFTMKYLWVKWQANTYNDMYGHDETKFVKSVASIIQPIINNYMSGISEQRFETDTGNLNTNLQALLTPYMPTNGLTWDPTWQPPYTSYFGYLENPNMNYDTNPPTPNHISPRKDDPYISSAADNSATTDDTVSHVKGFPNYVATPTPTMMPPTDKTPGSQAELDAMIDEMCQEHPELCKRIYDPGYVAPTT